MTSVRPIPKLVVRAHDPDAALRRRILLAVGGLALAIGAAWLAVRWAAPEYGETRVLLAKAEAELRGQSQELEALRREVAMLKRNEQVNDSAGTSLRDMLRDREEEIAQLRADLEFYRRLVGGQGGRRGLTVHEFELSRIEDSTGYAFALTLLQNVKKGTVTQGSVEIALAGIDSERRLKRIGWAELSQDPAAKPLAFSLKYFQRLTGNLVIPNGFTPNRVEVVVKSSGGEQASQEFDWTEVLAAPAVAAAATQP
jgi:hypothetical protein